MNKLDVVVIDDQPSVCKEVASFLHAEYNVHAFKSGAEAIDFLGRGGANLILLDYYMPDTTGFEVLLQLRANKATADIPVVFLTAEINDRLEEEMKHRGAVDYLRKPIDATLLRSIVRKHIK